MTFVARIRFFARTILRVILKALNNFLFNLSCRVQDSHSILLIIFRRIVIVILSHRVNRNDNHRFFKIDIDILRLLHQHLNFGDRFVTSLVTIDALDGIHILAQALEVQSILLHAVLFVTIDSNAPVHINIVHIDHIAICRRQDLHNRSKLVKHHEHRLFARVAILVGVSVSHKIASVAFFVRRNLPLFVNDIRNHSLVTFSTLGIVSHRKDAHTSLQVNIRLFFLRILIIALRSVDQQVTFGVTVQDLACFGISLVRDRHRLALHIDNLRNFNHFNLFLFTIFANNGSLDDFTLVIGVVRNRNRVTIHNLVVRDLEVVANRLRLHVRLRILFKRNLGLGDFHHFLHSLIRHGYSIQDHSHLVFFLLLRRGICISRINNGDFDFLSLAIRVNRRVLLVYAFNNRIDVFSNDLDLVCIDIDNRSGSAVANFDCIGTFNILIGSLILLDNELAAFLQSIKASLRLAILGPFHRNHFLICVNRLVLRRFDIDGVTSFHASDFDNRLFNNVAHLDGNISRILEFAIRHIDLDNIGLLRFVIKFTLQDNVTIRLDFELVILINRIELQVTELRILCIRILSFNRSLLGTRLRIFREREFLRSNRRRFVHVNDLDNHIIGKFKTISILDRHLDGELLHLFVVNLSAILDSDFTILLHNHIRAFFSKRE